MQPHEFKTQAGDNERIAEKARVQTAERHRQELAQAWDEGYVAGGYGDDPFVPTGNPYES